MLFFSYSNVIFNDYLFAFNWLGNLMKEEEVLDFLLAQLVNDEIEDINENILDQLVETTESVAVFFC